MNRLTSQPPKEVFGLSVDLASPGEAVEIFNMREEGQFDVYEDLKKYGLLNKTICMKVDSVLLPSRKTVLVNYFVLKPGRERIGNGGQVDILQTLSSLLHPLSAIISSVHAMTNTPPYEKAQLLKKSIDDWVGNMKKGELEFIRLYMSSIDEVDVFFGGYIACVFEVVRG